MKENNFFRDRDSKISKILESTSASPPQQLSSFLADINNQKGEVSQELDEVWDSVEHFDALHPVDSQRIFQRVQHQIKPSKSIILSYRRFHRYGVAASVLFFLLFVSLITFFWSKQYLSNSDLISYKTESGEILRILLPDSSIMWLDESSSLSYAAGFSEREVELKGKAYFKVKKDRDGENFTVVAEKLNVVVLGTSFSVASYTDKNVRVAVEEGKVKVEGGNYAKFLLRDQAVTYNSSSGFSEILVGDNSNISSFIRSPISFNDKTFEEVALMLEQRFGKKIVFTSASLKACVLMGEHKVDSLTSILNTIEFVLNCEIKQDKDTVYVSGKGC